MSRSLPNRSVSAKRFSTPTRANAPKNQSGFLPDTSLPSKSPGPQAPGFLRFLTVGMGAPNRFPIGHGLTPGSSWIISERNGGIVITASQKIARIVGASSRSIQAAQPGTSTWDAEEQAIRASSSIPWYDIGALEAPATIASEHFVWFQDGMVFKATAYGRFGHSIDKGPGKATPLEYFRRIAASNEAFNDSATIVGKFENENGSLGLIHAQDFIAQNPVGAFHATPEQLIKFLDSLGFFPSEGHFSKYEVWANADLGIEIADFHSGNVILNSEGVVVPIDIVVHNFDPTKGVDFF